MAARQRSIIPMIDVNYKQFSPAEKKVADFFIANEADVDLSASAMAERLFVSEATLSRFAKKSGFSGYREFAFAYRNQKLKKHATMTNVTKGVLADKSTSASLAMKKSATFFSAGLNCL